MQYSFTSTAILGSVLAVTGNATPLSQSSTSVAVSTPSFSPEYTNVAGTFTAIAGSSPTPTPTPSSTFDFSGFPTNFGLGPVVPQSGIPELSTTLSTSTVGTPTKISATGSATASLFPGFHPHFGHGPAVPGKGFNHTHQPSNSTVGKPKSATTYLTAVNAELDHYVDKRCKYYFMRFMCERWMRIDRWWNKGGVPYHKHASHEAHHKHHKSLQGRSPSSVEVTPTTSSIPTLAPTKDYADLASMFLNGVDRPHARRELDDKIRDRRIMIDYYKDSIADMKEDIANLKKNKKGSYNGPDKALHIRNAELSLAYEMEQLKKLEDEKRMLIKQRKQLGG